MNFPCSWGKIWEICDEPVDLVVFPDKSVCFAASSYFFSHVCRFQEFLFDDANPSTLLLLHSLYLPVVETPPLALPFPGLHTALKHGTAQARRTSTAAAAASSHLEHRHARRGWSWSWA